MPRITIDVPAAMRDQLKEHAARHPVVEGNVSAVVREALLFFFANRNSETRSTPNMEERGYVSNNNRSDCDCAEGDR